MTCVLPARAKLNLELRVLGRRPDGQHEIESTLQTISLHDLLEVGAAPVTSLEILEGEAPVGADNLVLKAARALERAVGRPLPARFRLFKRIPAGAGLGGGSADAAAALRGLAAVYGLDGELDTVAAEVGADVPFLLGGGAALAGGRGERLWPAEPGSGWFALAWPGFGVSTAAVYEAWDRSGGEGSNHLLRAACEVDPRLADFAESLGAGWLMTGSGSAFFKSAGGPAEAAAAVAGRECWTAVAAATGAW